MCAHGVFVSCAISYDMSRIEIALRGIEGVNAIQLKDKSAHTMQACVWKAK